MMKRSGLLVMALMALVFVGCTKSEVDRSSSVRIGFFPNVTHAQALIGQQDLSYEKMIGKPVEWVQFNAGPSEVEAMFAGELDLGFIGPGPAVNAFSKSDGDIQIIAGVAEAGAVLIASAQSGISDVATLDGKKIAVPQFGNTQDLCLRNLIYEQGLQETTKGGTVEIVQVANADVQALLERGEIDGALVPEPWGTLLEKNVGARVILESDEVFADGQYPTAVIIARKDFIKENPEVVAAFLKAHAALTDQINQDRDKVGAVINERLKALTNKTLDQEVMRKALDRIRFSVIPSRDATYEIVDLSVLTGFLKEPPNTEALFDLSFLEGINQ